MSKVIAGQTGVDQNVSQSGGDLPQVQNLHIRQTAPLIAPWEMREKLPALQESNQTIISSREAIRKVLVRTDRRLLVITGPCSIHDEKSALEYAERLRKLSLRLSDRLLLVMRVYFEKPRTITGWKGLINDPHLNGTFDLSTGLHRARALLLKITEMGLATATEFLDPITPRYVADLVSWAAIGARTTESQTHRQMASGLSMPVGFKNGTDGQLEHALNAMLSARHPHSFLGIADDGRVSVIHASGNPWGHIILRGGTGGPNHDPESIYKTTEALRKRHLTAGVMIDCSHANCGKDPTKEGAAFYSVLKQRAMGNTDIIGTMLESHLFEGRQNLGDSPEDLKYGVSITDPCIGWEETEEILIRAHKEMGSPQANQSLRMKAVRP